MAETQSLTGRWDGVFKYPAGHGPTTPFVAIIVENSGSLSGTIIEPDQFYGTGQVEAKIEGHRAERFVDFTKTYQQGTEGYENPVDYVGHASEDGQKVFGMWSLKDMNGEFEMTREAEMETPHKQTVEAEA